MFSEREKEYELNVPVNVRFSTFYVNCNNSTLTQYYWRIYVSTSIRGRPASQCCSMYNGCLQARFWKSSKSNLRQVRVPINFLKIVFIRRHLTF